MGEFNPEDTRYDAAFAQDMQNELDCIKAEEQQLKDSEEMKIGLDGQFLVLTQIDEREKLRVATMFELSAINRKYNDLTAAALSNEEKQNLEVARGYNEQDVLQGEDAYSSSKSAADIATQSYIKTILRTCHL